MSEITDEEIAAFISWEPDVVGVELERIVARLKKAEAERNEWKAKFEDVLDDMSVPSFEDPRLRYVEIQISRSLWLELEEYRKKRKALENKDG